jgi:hypothetical protein
MRIFFPNCYKFINFPDMVVQTYQTKQSMLRAEWQCFVLNKNGFNLLFELIWYLRMEEYWLLHVMKFFYKLFLISRTTFKLDLIFTNQNCGLKITSWTMFNIFILFLCRKRDFFLKRSNKFNKHVKVAIKKFEFLLDKNWL